MTEREMLRVYRHAIDQFLFNLDEHSGMNQGQLHFKAAIIHHVCGNLVAMHDKMLKDQCVNNGGSENAVQEGPERQPEG